MSNPQSLSKASGLTVKLSGNPSGFQDLHFGSKKSSEKRFSHGVSDQTAKNGNQEPNYFGGNKPNEHHYQGKGISTNGSKMNLNSSPIAQKLEVWKASPDSKSSKGDFESSKELRKNASSILISHKELENLKKKGGAGRDFGQGSPFSPKPPLPLTKKSPFEPSENQRLDQKPPPANVSLNQGTKTPNTLESNRKEARSQHGDARIGFESVPNGPSERNIQSENMETLKTEGKINSPNDSVSQILNRDLETRNKRAQSDDLTGENKRLGDTPKPSFEIAPSFEATGTNLDFVVPLKEKNVTGSGGFSRGTVSEFGMPRTSLTTLNFSKPGGFANGISTLSTEISHLSAIVREQGNSIFQLQKQKTELEETHKKQKELIQANVREHVNKHIWAFVEKINKEFESKKEEINKNIKEAMERKVQEEQMAKKFEEECKELSREAQNLKGKIEQGSPGNQRRNSSQKKPGKQVYVGKGLNSFALGNSGLFSGFQGGASPFEEKELEREVEFNRQLKSELSIYKEEKRKLQIELESGESPNMKIFKEKYESSSKRERMLMAQEIEAGFSCDPEYFMKVLSSSAKVLGEYYRTEAAENQKLKRQLDNYGIAPNFETANELSQLVQEKEAEIEKMKKERAHLKKEIEEIKRASAKETPNNNRPAVFLSHKFNFEIKKKKPFVSQIEPETSQHDAPTKSGSSKEPKEAAKNRYVSTFNKKK